MSTESNKYWNENERDVVQKIELLSQRYNNMSDAKFRWVMFTALLELQTIAVRHELLLDAALAFQSGEIDVAKKLMDEYMADERTLFSMNGAFDRLSQIMENADKYVEE